MAKPHGKRNVKAMVFRSPELERVILDELCSGRSLTKICEQPGYPTASAVVRWAAVDPDFRQRYLEARQVGAQLMADQLVDLSMTALNQESMAKVQGVRVATDVQRWWLSHVLPDFAHTAAPPHVQVVLTLPPKQGVPDPRYPGSARLIEAMPEDD